MVYSLTEVTAIATIPDGAWGAIGAFVAGAFTLIVLYIQGNFAIRRLRSALATPETIRESVRLPVEGRWDYEMEYDEYDGVRPGDEGCVAVYRSDGIADFTWNGHYSILLAYEVKNGLDQIVTISICKGMLIHKKDTMLPKKGDKMVFHYSHRLGIRRKSGENVSLLETPERKFFFELTSVRTDAKGSVRSMVASYAVQDYKGTARFTRRT